MAKDVNVVSSTRVRHHLTRQSGPTIAQYGVAAEPGRTFRWLGDSTGERPPSLLRSLPNKTAAGGPSTQRHRTDEVGEDVAVRRCRLSRGFTLPYSERR
jgi:hypothetical protein